MPIVTMGFSGRQVAAPQLFFGGPCIIETITAPASVAKVSLYDENWWERHYRLAANEIKVVNRPVLSRAMALVGVAGVQIQYSAMTAAQLAFYQANPKFWQVEVVTDQEPWPHNRRSWQNETSLQTLPPDLRS